MKAAVTVDIDGATFVLDEGAFLALRSYLDRAAARLGNHPDRADVIAGLERRIAAKLANGPGAEGMPLDRGEMLAALKEVGRVDGPELSERGPASPDSAPRASQGAEERASHGAYAGASAGAPSGAYAGARRSTPPRARRLYRLREGQHVAGVCAGLAAFSEIDVGMIRFLFLIGLLFSGGVLIVAYVVLAFVMPIARTEAEIAEAHGGFAGPLTRE
jgi:phage shock protein C